MSEQHYRLTLLPMFFIQVYNRVAIVVIEDRVCDKSGLKKKDKSMPRVGI